MRKCPYCKDLIPDDGGATCGSLECDEQEWIDASDEEWERRRIEFAGIREPNQDDSDLLKEARSELSTSLGGLLMMKVSDDGGNYTQ